MVRVQELDAHSALQESLGRMALGCRVGARVRFRARVSVNVWVRVRPMS